jgi:hypothetical protein
MCIRDTGCYNNFWCHRHDLSLQRHLQKRSPKHVRRCFTLGLPLPQNTNNLRSYIRVWQSARRQKHRKEFHARPQKCTLPMRRPKAAQYLRYSAQSRSSDRMQESHRTRRWVQESIIGPKSPKQNCMHRCRSKPVGTSRAASIPWQKYWCSCMVNLRSSGGQQRRYWASTASQPDRKTQEAKAS